MCIAWKCHQNLRNAEDGMWARSHVKYDDTFPHLGVGGNLTTHLRHGL